MSGTTRFSKPVSELLRDRLSWRPSQGLPADSRGGSDSERCCSRGSAVFAAGLVWFATTTGLHPDYPGVWLPGTLIIGLGIGMTFPVLSAAAVSSLHPRAIRGRKRRQPDSSAGGWRTRCGVARCDPRCRGQSRQGARQLSPSVVVRRSPWRWSPGVICSFLRSRAHVSVQSRGCRSRYASTRSGTGDRHYSRSPHDQHRPP